MVLDKLKQGVLGIKKSFAVLKQVRQIKDDTQVEYVFDENKNPTIVIITMKNDKIKLNFRVAGYLYLQMRVLGRQMAKIFKQEIEKDSGYKFDTFKFKNVLIAKGAIQFYYEATIKK